MSEIQKVDTISNKLISSIEEILKYTQLNNTPELVKNNDPENEVNEENEDFNMYSDEEEEDEEGDGAHQNDILTRNLFRNINAKRHEVASIDSIEQIQVLHKHSKNIVKSIQELLLITKHLKEKWALKHEESLEENETSLEAVQKTNDNNEEEIKACIEGLKSLI